MSTVQLSDIIDVTVFEDLVSENDPKLTALYQSGVIASSDLFNSLASAAGRSAELPFWRDLDHSSEPNYSSDQAVDATPDNVQQDVQKTRKVHVNNGWSAMDLAVELQTGTNAMQHIRDRTAAYWTYYWQDRLVACALGILSMQTSTETLLRKAQVLLAIWSSMLLSKMATMLPQQTFSLEVRL